MWRWDAPRPVGRRTGASAGSPGKTKISPSSHIHKTADGAYVGAIDSVDQVCSTGRPLSEIVATPDTLSFTISPHQGSLCARTWNAPPGPPLDRAAGQPRTWAYPDGAGRVAPALPTIAGLDGDWDGALNVSLMKLRLAFHFKTGPHGTLGTIDSIDEQATGGPVSNISR